jgi:hypothetical protein
MSCKYLKTKCPRKYFDVRGTKEVGNEEYYVMRNFIVCTTHLTLFG